MTRELEDFLYQLEKTDTRDLINYGLDDVWIADLTDEELIVVIGEMSRRLLDLTKEDEDDWYEEELLEDLEEWGE